MSKNVEFVYDETVKTIVAGFYADSKEYHRKILNPQEIAGLQQVINFETLPYSFEAKTLLDMTDKIVFDRHQDEPTNFELLLIDLVYRV